MAVRHSRPRRRAARRHLPPAARSYQSHRLCEILLDAVAVAVDAPEFGLRRQIAGFPRRGHQGEAGTLLGRLGHQVVIDEAEDVLRLRRVPGQRGERLRRLLEASALEERDAALQVRA